MSVCNRIPSFKNNGGILLRTMVVLVMGIGAEVELTGLRTPFLNPNIPLGAQLKPVSIYGGAQHFVTVHIFKDFKTGNWWLAFGKDKKIVGYWVKSIFNHMDNGARKISWGGAAEAPLSELSPPMGSGHFPFEGFGKAAVFMDATIVDENNNHFIPNPHDFYPQVGAPRCYKVDKLGSGPNGIGFYFGGPGGCRQ
ncbi:hypothetical protein LUZ60_016276 [Juncus effusus]|nr:hypothetical protein LUZ60_016276 [Juncus effusus]